VLVVIDTNREDIAVKEAKRLKIPVIGIVDSNADPSTVDFPVPGNDDAMRAIQLYCDLFAGAVLDGLQQELAHSGKDIGASETVPQVVAVEGATKAPAAETAAASAAPAAETAAAPAAETPAAETAPAVSPEGSAEATVAVPAKE